MTQPHKKALFLFSDYPLIMFCPYKERQHNCLWKLLYELLGHDELSQCAYVLKVATINSNLCFSNLNITKATVKLLFL